MTLCATLQHDGESSEPLLTGLTGQRLITLHETGHVQHQQNNPSCNPADFLAPAPACIPHCNLTTANDVFLFPGRPFSSPLPPPLSSSSHVTCFVPGLTRTYLCGRPPLPPPEARPQCRPQHCTSFPSYRLYCDDTRGQRHPVRSSYSSSVCPREQEQDIKRPPSGAGKARPSCLNSI
jgi:hypothetical protein